MENLKMLYTVPMLVVAISNWLSNTNLDFNCPERLFVMWWGWFLWSEAHLCVQIITTYGSFTLHGAGNGIRTGNRTGNVVFCSHCSTGNGTGNGTGNRRNLWAGIGPGGEMGLEPIRPLSSSLSWCSVYSTKHNIETQHSRSRSRAVNKPLHPNPIHM